MNLAPTVLYTAQGGSLVAMDDMIRDHFNKAGRQANEDDIAQLIKRITDEGACPHQPSQFEQIVDLKISDLPCGRPQFGACHKANPRC